MAYQTIRRMLWIWWNWFVEENKRRNFKKIIYQTVRCRISVMSRSGGSRGCSLGQLPPQTAVALP